MKNLILMLLVLCLAFTYADNWQSIPAKGDIPSPRFGHTMVQINGTYYLFGGVNALDSRGTPYNDLYAYVPETKTFSKVNASLASGSEPIPGMTGHTAMVYNNEMYVFNGSRSTATNDSTYVFTPGNPTWTQKSAPPFEARTESAAAADGSDMYMIGGRKNETGTITDEVWKYNFTTDTWEPRRAIPWGGMAGANAMIYTNTSGQKKLYVYGGVNDQGEQATLWEQTVVYNTWKTANQFGEMPSPRGYAIGLINGSNLWVSGGFGGSGALRESQQLGDTYKLDLSNAQGPTWVKVKEGPAHWKAAGYLVVDGEDINLCVLGGIKDNAPITLAYVSQYSTNDDPPPVPKTITSQIGALGNHSYALYFFAFGEDQAKVTVNIAWKQADAQLRLCALYLPIMIRGDHPMANMSGIEETPDKISAAHLMMLERSKEAVERTSPITKTFTNLKPGTLILLLIHKNGTPTARNIQFELSEYTSLPKNVTFLFPVGNPDKNSTTAVKVQTSFMKFPTTPIRWKARLPLLNYLKENVIPGDVWTWTCDDTFPRPFFFPAYVKFALP